MAAAMGTSPNRTATTDSRDSPHSVWRDILGPPTPRERINFLRACRIVLDSSAQLLRRLCKEERISFSHDKCLEECDFSSLADGLINPKTRLLKGKVRLGSFFVFASSQVSLSRIKPEGAPLSIKNNWTELKVFKWDENFQGVPPECKVIIVNFKKSEFTRKDENVLYLHRTHDKGEEKMNNIEVYFTTEKHDAVDHLREIRNERIGHPNCVAMSDKEFQKLFEDVTACYEVLGCDSGDIEDLRKIREETIMEEDVLCKLERYEPQLATLWSNNGVNIYAETVNLVRGAVINMQQNITSHGLLTSPASLPHSSGRYPTIEPPCQKQLLPSVGPGGHGDKHSRKAPYKPGIPCDPELGAVAESVFPLLQARKKKIEWFCEKLGISQDTIGDCSSGTFMDGVSCALFAWRTESEANDREALASLLSKMSLSTCCTALEKATGC